jgi:hypothetical protein
VYQGSYEYIAGTHLFFECPSSTLGTLPSPSPPRYTTFSHAGTQALSNIGDGEAQEEDVQFVCAAQKKVVFRQVELIPKTTVSVKPSATRSGDVSALRDAVGEESPAFYVTTTGPDGMPQPQT